jgi:hypothetical protein
MRGVTFFAGAVFVCACGPSQPASTPEATPGPSASASAAPLPAPTASTQAPAATPAAKGDESELRAVLTKLMAPGADRAALSKALEPTHADYAAMFDAGTAAKLAPRYDHLWSTDPPAFGPREGQTELVLVAATTEDLAAGSGKATELAGGWRRVAPHMAPHRTWYRAVFTRPGERHGRSFEGFTFVNGHWAIAPKPWMGL